MTERRARLLTLLDALAAPARARSGSERAARLGRTLGAMTVRPSMRGAGPSAPALVSTDVNHAATAALLAQEGMARDVWRKLAVDALNDLRGPEVDRVAAVVEARLLTADAAHGWLIEDPWLQALRAGSVPGRRVLVAARLYHDQEPIARAAADVSDRLDRADRGLAPHDNDVLTEADLAAYVVGNVRGQRALRDALVALGIADKEPRGALRIKRPSTHDREDAFGWLVTAELRADGRSEATRAWVASRSRAVRLLGCAPHQVERLFFAARAGGWWTTDIFVGQDRLILPQRSEAPTSVAEGLLDAADSADRTGHSADDLRRWAASFREGLRGFAFTRFGDPTPVLQQLRGHLFRTWPEDRKLRHEHIRHALSDVDEMAAHALEQGPDFLGLPTAPTEALGAVASEVDDVLAAEDTGRGDALTAAIERLPPEVFARMLARMAEDRADGAAPLASGWLQEHAVEIRASAESPPRARWVDDAPGRILRFGSGIEVDERADTRVAALQRLALKAAKEDRPRAGRLVAQLAGEVGQLAAARMLVLELEQT
jgi:hypothetical protein